MSNTAPITNKMIAALKALHSSDPSYVAVCNRALGFDARSRWVLLDDWRKMPRAWRKANG